MKKTTVGLVLMFMLGLPLLANADYFGTFCFQVQDYSDAYKWRVDRVDDSFQVTGNNWVYPSAMNGGGIVLSNNHLLLTVNEDANADGFNAVHIINVDLPTMTGTDSSTYYLTNGTVATYYVQQPITRVDCAGLPVAGQKQAGKTLFVK